jgi:transcriptional regulator
MWSYDTSTIEVLGPEARMAEQTELLHGTLDTLILKTLSWGPRHGYGIARWIQDTTDDALQIGEGSLYPALYRMERKGWIEAEWGKSETGRDVKFYGLTTAGRARLKLELAQWKHFTTAISKVLFEER